MKIKGYEDMRSYIKLLEEKDLLVRVKREVDPRFEIAGVMEAVQDELKKAVFFEKVKGYQMPIVGNLFTSRKGLAFAFGTTVENLAEAFANKLGKRVEAEIVKDGPVKEVIKTDEKLNILKELPVCTYHEKDGVGTGPGPYISSGIAVARDPETGYLNASYNRVQIANQNHTHIRMMSPQHLGLIQQKAERAGKPLDVAIVIGTDPFTSLAAATSIPFQEEEYSFAGALREEPLRLVKCETSDVLVPANAEIVLEGEVKPNVREPEGPWADVMGFYIPIMDNHVFNVKAITHRKKPIFPALLSTGIESYLLSALGIEANILKAVRGSLRRGEVKAVATYPVSYTCFISIKKEVEGQAKNAMMAAFGAENSLKCIVCVDDDVNIFNPMDVWWAIASRARLDDIFLVRNAQHLLGERDVHRLYHMKLGIDATVPLEVPKLESERATIPGREKIKLENYLK